MSKFNLEKSVEKAKFVLEKKKVGVNVRASVCMALDVSGSTRGLFGNGSMQTAFQQILPIGITFDDNQQIDVYTFCDGKNIAHVEPNADEKNYSNYIKKNILDSDVVPLWGGTDYTPVIERVLNDFGFYKKGLFGFGSKLGKKSSSGDPVVLYFFTDGENEDKNATRKILEACQEAKTEIYFLFIGIGNANFTFIKDIADRYDNTGFMNVHDIDKLAESDEIYDHLLPTELCEWLKTSK